MTLNNCLKKLEKPKNSIIEGQAISFAVTHSEPLLIDDINILNALY